jgi:hypothetical protein
MPLKENMPSPSTFILFLKILIPFYLMASSVIGNAQTTKLPASVRSFSKPMIADYVGLIKRVHESDQKYFHMYYTDYAKFLRASADEQIEVWPVTEKKVIAYLDIAPPGPRSASFKEEKSDFMLPEEMIPAKDWEYRYLFATYDNTLDNYKGDGDTDHYGKETRPWVKPVMVDLRIFDKDANEFDPITMQKTGRHVVRIGKGLVLVTPGSPYKLNGALTMHGITFESILNASDFAQEAPNRKFIVLYYHPTSDSNGLSHLLGDSDLRIGAKHSDPIRPFIIADDDLSDAGTVLRGKAMCVADCPRGKLFRLLKKGDNLFH